MVDLSGPSAGSQMGLSVAPDLMTFLLPRVFSGRRGTFMTASMKEGRAHGHGQSRERISAPHHRPFERLWTKPYRQAPSGDVSGVHHKVGAPGHGDCTSNPEI